MDVPYLYWKAVSFMVPRIFMTNSQTTLPEKEQVLPFNSSFFKFQQVTFFHILEIIHKEAGSHYFQPYTLLHELQFNVFVGDLRFALLLGCSQQECFHKSSLRVSTPVNVPLFQLSLID